MRALGLGISIFLTLFFLSPLTIQAQTETNDGPKVGVVLSGGGALGFAHVGALKVIEEAGIRPDYVTGTSMGAVIGALYAYGYTPDQIETIIRDIDWKELMNPKVDRKFYSYTERKSREKRLFTVGLKDYKVVVPGGINDAHKLDLMLSRILVDAHELESFDSLPKPYRCVAVDWVSAEEIVFSNGNLPEAARSSASIPAYFDPIITDENYLIDGGVLNNFPADHLKALGADIIVGVDIGTTEVNDPENAAFTDILLKTSFFYGAKTNAEKRKLCDILILPNTEGYSPGGFTDANEIMPKGEEAARLQFKGLEEIARKQGADSDAHSIERSIPDSLKIGSIKVVGNENISKNLIVGNVSIPTHTRFPEEDMSEGMERLWATGLFRKVGYTLKPKENGEYDLTIKVRESDVDWSAGVGLHYDSDFGIAALLSLNNRNTFISGLNSSLDVVLSENPKIQFQLNRARGNQLHTALDYNMTIFTVNLLNENNQAIRTRFTQNSIKVSLNSRIRNNGLIRLGLSSDHTSIQFNFGGDVEPESFNYLNLFFDYRFDGFDRVSFPNEGLAGFFIAQYLANFRSFEESSIPQVLFDMTQHIPIGQKFNLSLRTAGASSFDLDAPDPYGVYYGGLGKNYLPNFMPFAGYNFVQNNAVDGLPIRTSLMLSAGLRYHLIKGHYVSVLANGLTKAYKLNQFAKQETLDYGWAVSYGLDTALGPFELSGYYNRETTSFHIYVNFGYWF